MKRCALLLTSLLLVGIVPVAGQAAPRRVSERIGAFQALAFGRASIYDSRKREVGEIAVVAIDGAAIPRDAAGVSGAPIVGKHAILYRCLHRICAYKSMTVSKLIASSSGDVTLSGRNSSGTSISLRWNARNPVSFVERQLFCFVIPGRQIHLNYDLASDPVSGSGVRSASLSGRYGGYTVRSSACSSTAVLASGRITMVA